MYEWFVYTHFLIFECSNMTCKNTYKMIFRQICNSSFCNFFTMTIGMHNGVDEEEYNNNNPSAARRERMCSMARSVDEGWFISHTHIGMALDGKRRHADCESCSAQPCRNTDIMRARVNLDSRVCMWSND